MKRAEEELDISSDSDPQDSSDNNEVQGRSIINYDQINVRNLSLSEIISRMNQLRQNSCSPEGAASSSTNICEISDSSISPTSGTDSAPISIQDCSSAELSPPAPGQVAINSKYKEANNISLQPLDLGKIPPACVRREPRPGGMHLHPYRVQFFGYQSGDAAMAHRIRLPPVISPIRSLRMNPRLFPRHPLGLGYGFTPRSSATKEFLASEFARSSYRKEFVKSEDKKKSDKLENEESCKPADIEGLKKSENVDLDESDPEDQPQKIKNSEETEILNDSE